MIKVEKRIAHDLLVRFISYEPSTGIFRWRAREADMMRGDKYAVDRALANVNGRSAGKIAGGLDKKGYVRIYVDGHSYAAHTLAWFYMTKEWPIVVIDHKNMDKSDNRISNLRQSTHSQNKMNNKVRIDNRSGLKGVKFHSGTGKWHARICVAGKRINLGLYLEPQEAHLAYVSAAHKYFGEFARAS